MKESLEMRNIYLVQAVLIMVGAGLLDHEDL